MEEKCSNAAVPIALTPTPTAVVSTISINDNQSLKPKQSFMSSIVQEDYANSQQDFAEVLDEETTTTSSAVLETFENNSSNSFRTCCKTPAAAVAAEVVIDDSSSTDTIKLVENVEDPATSSGSNKFLRGTEIYVIKNDNVEDKFKDKYKHMLENIESNGEETSQITVGESHIEGQPNGVIVTTSNGASVYLETPVIEDQQQHHNQIINLASHVNYADNNCRPKRLSDEFLLAEHDETLMDDNEQAQSFDMPAECRNEADSSETKKTDGGGGANVDAQHDKMSIRLKKMNINNSTGAADTTLNTTAQYNAEAYNDTIPTSSSSSASTSLQRIITPNMADIESMDLIERRDFETEQRLTGGIILKSSSLMNKNRLNLNIIESCIQQQQQKQQQQNPTHSVQSKTTDDFPSANTSSRRAVSSDSKCNYKDPPTTPTSSRSCSNRLSKSTVKINLCNNLSHPQQQQTQQQHTTVGASAACTNNQLQKPASSSSAISSVIVEAPLNSTNVATVAEVFSNTNSNDSLLCGGSISTSSSAVTNTTKSATTTTAEQKTSTNLQYQMSMSQQKQLLSMPATSTSSASATIEHEAEKSSASGSNSGCSRTNALHSTVSVAGNSVAAYDDAQPSTSSARCQYAPLPRNLRQVHASAQTQDRYLMRGVAVGIVAPSISSSYLSAASTSAAGSSNSNNNNAVAAISGGSSGINLCNAPVAARRRRHGDPTAHLTRNSTSEEVIAAFKVVVAEAAAAAAAAECVDFNDDNTCADCEEHNSDLEEICTCHNSSSGSSSSGGSSHGGSNISLNDENISAADEVDSNASVVACTKDDLSNYIQLVSISGQAATAAAVASTSYAGITQRKRKHNETRILSGDKSDCNAANVCSNSCGGSGGNGGDVNSRKRIAYDYASTPRSSHTQSTATVTAGSGALMLVATTPTSSSQLVSATGSPLSKRTPRSIIPTRDNPPPELPHWLAQFNRFSHAERLLALDRLIEHCEPTQVRHMMKVIEPQFQRDFISLLPRELALQVLAYLAPRDLLRAAQTCRSWRFLCDDNLLWKEKCRKAQILTEPRSDRPKRGRAGNMPPIASPWKAAYMRQHIIEMNWRSRPVREPKVLKGHDDHVITCLQFCGNRIVSGSDDNTLKVWSAVTGRCMRTLVGHTGGVWSSQMSGNIIISGSTDRTLKVWDMETGQCVHTLLGHTSTVRCMHLHGNKVVSGSRDATLRVWDIDQGTCLHVLVGHLAAVRCVQYDGKLIVSGAYDYMVKIWHPERQECLHTLQGHTNRVYSLQFDGLHVVSGSLDTSIRVWDVETGNCKHTLMGHQSLTSGMELRQNILVSGNADSTVKVWDITTGQCLQTLSGPNKHQSAVTCLQFNSRFVVTSSDDGTVKLWDVKTGEFIRNLVALDSGGSGGVVWRIRANDTKLICAVGSRNGTEETKLMVLDFDVEGACVKCS